MEDYETGSGEINMEDLLAMYEELTGNPFRTSRPSKQKTCKRRKLGVLKNSDTEIRNNE
jgi:hypothetical protein